MRYFAVHRLLSLQWLRQYLLRHVYQWSLIISQTKQKTRKKGSGSVRSELRVTLNSWLRYVQKHSSWREHSSPNNSSVVPDVIRNLLDSHVETAHSGCEKLNRVKKGTDSGHGNHHDRHRDGNCNSDAQKRGQEKEERWQSNKLEAIQKSDPTQLPTTAAINTKSERMRNNPLSSSWKYFPTSLQWKNRG